MHEVVEFAFGAKAKMLRPPTFLSSYVVPGNWYYRYNLESSGLGVGYLCFRISDFKCRCHNTKSHVYWDILGVFIFP